MADNTNDNNETRSFRERFDEAFKGAFKSFTDEQINLMGSLDERASSIVGKFGQSRQYAEGIRQSLSLAVPELQLISSNSKDFAESLQMAADAQIAITDALRTNVLLTTQQMISIAQTAKAYGIQNQELSGFIERFITVGETINNFPEIMEGAANNARRLGVNVSAVMTNIKEGLSEMNKYGFTDGVAGLGRMAALTASMRVDMKSIFTFAEDVFNPEGAIEMVAAFQRLGVATGDLADPFRLMYLASEDTEELTRQVSKLTENFSFFNKETGRFELYPNAKRDLRDLATATKIPYDELVKMGQAADRLKIVGKDIRIGVPEDTKQLIANVAQFDKLKGGFTIKLTTGETKLVSEINESDIKSIQEANKELSAKEIAIAQLDSLKAIENNFKSIGLGFTAPAAGSTIVSSTAELLRGGSRAVREGVATSIPPEVIQQRINNATQQGLNMVADVISGKRGLHDVTKSLVNVAAELETGLKKLGNNLMSFDYSGEFKKEIMPTNQFKELGGTLTNALQSSIENISKSLGIDTKGLNLNQTINQNTNVKVDPIKVDVTGNVNLGNNGRENINITPELKSYIEGVVKSQLSTEGTMSSKPSTLP